MLRRALLTVHVSYGSTCKYIGPVTFAGKESSLKNFKRIPVVGLVFSTLPVPQCSTCVCASKSTCTPLLITDLINWLYLIYSNCWYSWSHWNTWHYINIDKHNSAYTFNVNPCLVVMLCSYTVMSCIYVHWPIQEFSPDVFKCILGVSAADEPEKN